MKHRSRPMSEIQVQPSAPDVPRIGIIVACDDERFIGSLILSLRSSIDELIVIDDGSTDNTANIARYAGATVLEHATHQGRLAAANTGLEYIRQNGPATVIVLDATSEHHANDIARVVEAIERGEADIVMGVQASGAGSEAATSDPLSSDFRKSMYAFAPAVVESLRFDPYGASFEQQITAFVNHDELRFATATLAKPVAKKRPQPIPRQVMFGRFFRLIGEDRPLLFFGMSGLIVFLSGSMLGVYLTRIYAGTGRLAIGYGLLTVLLCVVGTVLFFAGIILHSTRAMMIELRRSLQLQGVGKEPPTSQVAMPGDTFAIADTPQVADDPGSPPDDR